MLANLDVYNFFAQLILQNIEIDNFDDFGVELCPVTEATICGSDLDVDRKIYFAKEKTNIEVSRYYFFQHI